MVLWGSGLPITPNGSNGHFCHIQVEGPERVLKEARFKKMSDRKLPYWTTATKARMWIIHDIIAKLSTAMRVWVVLDQQDLSQSQARPGFQDMLLKKPKEATLFGIEG